MSESSRALMAIAALPDQKQKTEQYKILLVQMMADPTEQKLQAFVDHMLRDDVALVISRQLLQLMTQELVKLPAALQKPIATYALEKTQTRVVSFDDSVTSLRETLSDLLEREEDYSKAAQVLAGIDLDSGPRSQDPAYRLAKNIRISMLYLEDDDSVSAESYIKKASALIGASADQGLELQYKTCYARILDAKRKFLDAGQRYYEISQMSAKPLAGGLTLSSDDLDQALGSAITAAILAPAGPQRSRLLSTLYKDERSARSPKYGFLEKVYLERILTGPEIDSFAHTLKPHQMATFPDGTTVLARAVSQHNLLSASKLYNNISIEQLGHLLGVEPSRAETIAADMIQEGRMPGSIDQVDRLIRFDHKVDGLLQWDAQIQNVCRKVNDIIDDIMDDPATAGAM
ncbi:MAG: hypothetical protein WDW38_001246 [Sanguina aurantia]